MAVVIDPKLQLIRDDHRVYVLHPGEKKRFYREFIEQRAVFLDIPGAYFSGPPNIEIEETRNKLRMSRAIASWHRKQRPPDKRPSRNPDDYKASHDGREKPRYMHEVEELYTEARPGDLVVVPGSGYASAVLIGEFVGSFNPDFKIELPRYGSDKIHARQVIWLDNSFLKGNFSTTLIRLMQNRQALIKINTENERRQIYNAAYGDYAWKETSGNLIRTIRQDVDLNDFSEATKLVNYFCAQYFALKKGELDEFMKLNFYSAIEEYYDKSQFTNMALEIHSPGIIERVMKNALLASYVSSMLALSASNVSPQDGATATIDNSASRGGKSVCDVQLEAEIRQTMEMYANYDIWEKMVCVKRMKVESNVGLKTDAEVKK